jgi:hypothetical protein
MGRDVVLVSSADETAFEVRGILAGADESEGAIGRGDDRPGTLRVFSSGDVGWFRTVGSRLFGEELGEVQGLTWPAPPPVPAPAAPRSLSGGRSGAASG